MPIKSIDFQTFQKRQILLLTEFFVRAQHPHGKTARAAISFPVSSKLNQVVKRLFNLDIESTGGIRFTAYWILDNFILNYLLWRTGGHGGHDSLWIVFGVMLASVAPASVQFLWDIISSDESSFLAVIGATSYANVFLGALVGVVSLPLRALDGVSALQQLVSTESYKNHWMEIFIKELTHQCLVGTACEEPTRNALERYLKVNPTQLPCMLALEPALQAVVAEPGMPRDATNLRVDATVEGGVVSEVRDEPEGANETLFSVINRKVK